MPMIVDTAASYLTVRPDVFDQLEVTPVQKVPLVTASERAEAPLGRVDKVTVGTHCSAVNVQLISIPLPEIFQPRDSWELPFSGIFLFQ